MSSAGLQRVHSVPSYRLVMKMFNRTGPSTDSWGALLLNWPPTRPCAADHPPLHPATKPVFNPPQPLPIQPVHQQLLQEDLMEDRVKHFPEVWVDNVHCFPFICRATHFITEGGQVDQVELPFSEAVLTPPGAWQWFPELCSTTFPGLEVRPTGL